MSNLETGFWFIAAAWVLTIVFMMLIAWQRDRAQREKEAILWGYNQALKEWDLAESTDLDAYVADLMPPGDLQDAWRRSVKEARELLAVTRPFAKQARTEGT